MIDTFSYEKIEMFFANFSFVSLFVAMLAYWSDLSERFVRRDANDVFASFPVASRETQEDALALRTLVEPLPARVGLSAVVASNLALFVLLALRWFDSGHFPLSNLYESLLFLTWTLTSFHLFLRRTLSEDSASLGAITAPTALLVDAFANFSLPSDMQRASALVPALKSNWLMMHVTVMILSYGALIFGSLLAIGFLMLTVRMPSVEFSGSKEASEPPDCGFSPTKVAWAKTLDNVSYRLLGIGFPLLSVGILSGAVWANEAWGSYWSWDPKETWALLTWFVFAIYLHTRITKNWQGKKPAMIASLGFFMVWVCYLGVNLLGEGLHSYGWLKS